MANLLEVRDLATYFFTQDGVVKAVDGISYYLEEGEVLGIVGESGCGKSVSALSVMRLSPTPQAEPSTARSSSKAKTYSGLTKPRCDTSAATGSPWCSRSL